MMMTTRYLYRALHFKSCKKPTSRSRRRQITVWYNQNLLQGCLKKNQTIAFGSDKKHPEKAMNIKIGLEDIQQKDEMKLLGVLIDR